jgi:DNA topoisomerase-1
MSVGQSLEKVEILATERFSTCPLRYTEASLVRKLEELGIGRPSTYAPTISTVQQRGYVEKGNKEGVKRSYETLKLKGNKITEATKTEVTGNEKAKLIPTDVGTVVNDFLMAYFPEIMDYNFTANVEKEFDEVAEGNKEWTGLMENFYKDFHPLVDKTMNIKSEHKVGERILGTDPVSGKPVSVKIGRYGPVIQIGSAEDEEKPRFAQLAKGFSMETITLEEALDSFKLPRTLGDFEDKVVVVGVGRFGPYIRHNNAFVSIPKGTDPMEVSLEEAIELIQTKREATENKVIKSYAEEPELQVLNGRYGPYIAYQKKNYKIPENVVPKDLDLETCFKIIELQKVKKDNRKARSGSSKK